MGFFVRQICVVQEEKMSLIGVHPLLSPDLLHALASMGHGDEIVLADVNFPNSAKENSKVISGHGCSSINDLLSAILTVFPLDTYNFNPVLVMEVQSRDKNQGMKNPEIWNDFQAICDKAHGSKVNMLQLERFAFYDRAKSSYAVVSTGERSLYSSLILRKGLVLPGDAKAVTPIKDAHTSPNGWET